MSKLLSNLYRVCYGKYYDFIFKLTRNYKYLINWETPFYMDEAVLVTPLNDDFPFYLYVPYEQEKGNEYFIVADGYNTSNCKRAAKLSFYGAKYFKSGILTGKRRWRFSPIEKEELNKFLKDTSYWATSGRSWFKDMILDYNTALSTIEIPEDLPMPDYTKLPEK